MKKGGGEGGCKENGEWVGGMQGKGWRGRGGLQGKGGGERGCKEKGGGEGDMQ